MIGRRSLTAVARVCCAVALIALLMYSVDWNSLPKQLAAIKWPPTLLALIGLGLHFLVSPWKWQQALRMHNLDYTLPYLIRINGTGFFLNNFLPSAIGGDAYRVVKTLPNDGFRPRAVSAVIVERAVGFCAMILLGNLGAILLFENSAVARTFFMLAIFGGLVALLGLYLVRVGLLKTLALRILNSKWSDAISRNWVYLRCGGYRWISLVGISLIFQTIAILNIFFLFKGLSVDVSLAACALIGAASGLATIIPISINGIGVVEGSFAGTAVALGIPYEPALGVAVLIRLFVLPPSIVFGLLYAISGDPAPRARTALVL